jgi:tetratricopeptide (TPR) repeat protein
MKIVLKRFLLILLGILLSLVVLELSLRLAGFAVSSYQQYKNNKVLKNKSLYTIMCLGESTTAKNYPIQLQNLLNKKYPGKFSVIDAGIPATTLQTILNLSTDNIQKYNPDIAICMMGINDGFCNLNNKQLLKPKLKIHKLYLILKQHLKSHFNSKLLFAVDTNNMDFIQQYQYFRAQQNYEMAKKILELEIQKNPDNQHAQAELAYFYYFFLEKRIIGYNIAKKAIDNKPDNIVAKSIFYNIVLHHNKFENINLKEFKFYINKILNEDMDIFKGIYKFENYLFIKNNISVEQRNKILSTICENNINDKSLGFMAINCLEQKDYKKAIEYFDKAEELRLNFPNNETYKLYRHIIKKLIDNNIKVICMQYPVRSIKSLQKQLQNEPYFDKITFISNEENFKQALTSKNYNELFVDQFAGDFGHCTNLGNIMIAENIVKTLEELVN